MLVSKVKVMATATAAIRITEKPSWQWMRCLSANDDEAGTATDMTPNTEISVAVKDRRPGGTPRTAPARWLRFVRPALVLVVCALLAAGGYYAWRTGFGQDTASSSLITAVAQRGNLEDAITATGTLQPKDYVDVGTQVSGQLKKLLVDVGAVVKAGQLLAEIDPSVYQSKVDGDRAQLLNQQAQLADKQAQLVLAECRGAGGPAAQHRTHRIGGAGEPGADQFPQRAHRGAGARRCGAAADFRWPRIRHEARARSRSD